MTPHPPRRADDGAGGARARGGGEAASSGAPARVAVPAGLEIELVVALTPDGLIGRGGALPWRHAEDLAHFKRTTIGHTLLMGRRTWDSLPRLLPQRRHVVVSRSVAGAAGPDGVEQHGAHFFPSLETALRWLDRERAAGRLPAAERVFLIGGGELYRVALESLDPLPVRLHVTWVPPLELRDGDVRFPVDRAWIESRYAVAERRAGETPGLEFVVYERRAGAR